MFATRPLPFAVRAPVVEPGDADRLGQSVAPWFACDDADALHNHPVAQGTWLVFASKHGPFGPLFRVS